MALALRMMDLSILAAACSENLRVLGYSVISNARVLALFFSIREKETLSPSSKAYVRVFDWRESRGMVRSATAILEVVDGMKWVSIRVAIISGWVMILDECDDFFLTLGI